MDANTNDYSGLVTPQVRPPKVEVKAKADCR